MENHTIKQLAKRLNLTDPEPEEYILTEQDATTAILNAIEAAKRYKVWKYNEMGISQPEIASKLATIEWEKEIDREKVLADANSAKHQEIWHKEQRLREKEAAEKFKKDLQERCDAKYMFNLMKSESQSEHGKQLIVNEDNKRFITTLCYFLSNDIRFETELGYSLKKGLLIRGVAGVGKTYLVSCLRKNELNPILILSMIEIADEIKQNGEYEIKLGSNKVIYLDDVGTEEATINHYGTKINYFKNFIEAVYLRNKVFNKLMFSTNNSFAEIEERYGFRVRSRIKDMFNIIDVKGTDMRG